MGAATMKDDCGVMVNGPHRSGAETCVTPYVGAVENMRIRVVCRDDLFTTQQIGKEACNHNKRLWSKRAGSGGAYDEWRGSAEEHARPEKSIPTRRCESAIRSTEQKAD
jgi:hypothetical protein